MRHLRAALPDSLYAELRGSSDSETLFLLALAAMWEGDTMTEALLATARIVRERTGDAEAQLNLLMTDGHRLCAVRSSTVAETNSLYVAEGAPFAPRGVVLASEAPEAGPAWEPVTAHSWIEIGADGSVTIGSI